MAKTAAKVRKKVKIRKNVAEGVAHIHASFNNTIITITDRQGNACRGRRLVAPASRDHARARLLPLRSLLKLPAEWPSSVASRTSRFASRVLDPGVSLRCVRSMRSA
jgi:hypothetical protein